MDLWTFCIVFLLCFCTHIRRVLAEEGELVYKEIDDWREDSGPKNDPSVTELWFQSHGRLTTAVKKGGASWFITPSLNLPNTSYLDIEASCSEKPCQLEIYGTNQSSAEVLKNYQSIQNVTFETSQSVNTATIKKSFPFLYILARTLKIKRFYIYFIKIRYYFCKNATLYNTDLSKVNSSTTNISIKVQCPDNAVSSDNKSTNITTANCTPRGNWTFGKCVCEKGFHDNSATNQNQKCSSCATDYFKDIIGNEPCRECPDGKTNNVMHTGCKCKRDHYPGNDEDESCYAVPSKVEIMNFPPMPKTSINITWTNPKDDGGNFYGSITYTVKVYRCKSPSVCKDSSDDLTFFQTNLTTTYVTVFNLSLHQTYKIKVISMNNLKNFKKIEWKFAEKIFPPADKTTTTATTFTTEEPGPSESKREKKKNSNIFIYVGAAVGFVVVIVFVILILITKHRRGKLKKDGKDNHGFENIPLGQRIYVDPSAYDDPEAALKDFANEISTENLNLQRVIGGGEFGDVYKGILKTEDRGDIEVAAKTLKYDSDERSRKDFFLEGSAMGQFDDPNVIHLEGVITKSVPHMIVIEYMANGSLDNFLKQNDGEFTELQLVGMARGVASGMKYLAAMNFIHRDLAARNILVNEGMLCKVADFGLSRELENADESSPGEYCASGGKIPVRWTAPEAMNYRKFSTASDVWSYGILLWEIMSFAERPYWDWDNFKVLERVDEGYRLPAPKNCPKAVHDLMLLCWETNRENRPEFAAIVSMLDDWIRSPETIRYEKPSKRPVSGAGVNDPAMLIKKWLHDIRMSSYIPHFTQAGFTQLSDLAGLLDNDLQAIGVSLIGHRNKMLRTIRSLPITEETKKTPWNRATSLKV